MARYSSYILYLLVSVLVAVLYINDITPVSQLQRSLDDALCNMTAPEGKRPNIAIVMIDGKAQNKFGEWPWNYDLVADLAAATASAEPRTILFDFHMPEDAYQDSAGYTDILAGQLSWIKNAVLPYDLALANYRSSITSNPPELFNNSITVANPLGVMAEDASLQVRKVFLPAEKLLEDDLNLGFVSFFPDDDRVVRRHPLVMNYEGYYYPSQSLLASAVYLGVNPSEVKVVEDKEIEIGLQRTIPIQHGSQFYVRYSDGNPFTTYSAADVLTDGFDFSKLAGKMVIIAAEDPMHNETFKTPIAEAYSSTWLKATVIDDIINNSYIHVATGTSAVQLLILFLLGGICAFVLPRVTLMYRFVILGGSLVILANAAYFMVSSFGTIPQSAYIALELVLFMLAAPMLDTELIAGEKPKKKDLYKSKMSKVVNSSRANDTTIDSIPVRELRENPNDAANVATTAVSVGDLDLGQVHHDKTIEAIDHQTVDSTAVSLDTETDHDDIPDSGSQSGEYGAITLDEPEVTDSSESEPEDNPEPVISTPEQEPTYSMPQTSELESLGRYQITGILGKGAMGTVYKGIDPAINRPVALKTIRLDFVNDPAEMAELKERLFREAQAAGKLSHPNIVTIYDVGNEGHLQYIAMEYLEGQTLEDMIKRKTKFNYRIIAQIITQICNALEYAHDQGIVHRDIKPANLMVLRDYRVKVMDYGIARIDSNSMTKTGIAMGTPNYISPEQLKGQPIDRRADIFSLGVVMYEMLLGRRPFKGENITSLIYAILNNEPEKPSNINPQIPLLFDHIVAKALQKDPANRYQKASEIVASLHDFVESFTNR